MISDPLIPDDTTAVRTAPYFDADQQTAVDVDLDAPVLGRHEILEEIDRGGMGVVYRARDLTLDRVVALKAIRSGSFAGEEEVRLFYREARAAAQLRHPHIVPIYGMGLFEGQHCFTMALFPRGSLSRYIADYRRDVMGAVSLLAKVARAVHSAHRCGIIHCDLKPGNILLDESGEPVVSDFGLAKRMDASAALTLPVHPVGTPAYMAPEQARCGMASPAGDIWSLGVILYELLTGSRPFPSASADEVKQQILCGEIISPRRLRADLPRDLQTIVLTCLEKEPHRRYSSAAMLADDLERWQRGEAIQARPESHWQKLRRQIRRRAGVKAVRRLLFGLMLMGIGAAGVWGIIAYSSPELQQRRIVESMQRELAAGRPIELIGATGPPRWYWDRIDRARPALPDWPDRLFALASKEIRLLELLPDPQRQRYRFSAEVRPHNNIDIYPESGGCMGIFFQAGEQRTPFRSAEQYGCVVRFGAIHSARRMQVCCLCRLDPDFTDGSPNAWYGDLLTEPLPPPRPGGWHKLAVEVAPGSFAAYFDDRRIGEFRLSESWLKADHEAWWLKALGRPLSPAPAFSPRGALGLYVEKGGAEFRNVVVEPLPENPGSRERDSAFRAKR